MITLFKNISSLVRVCTDGSKYSRGTAMQDIAEIKNGAILFDGSILWTGTNTEVEQMMANNEIQCDAIYDMKGKTVLPGFVDSHTHIVFAGDRSNEFAMRLRGATYSDIAAAGGGIKTTVKATREASLDQLVEKGLSLAWSAIRHGTTAMEIKSGYGLTPVSEYKILEAIKIIRKELPIHVSSTFLGAHDIPEEYKSNRSEYIDILCKEMIPYVASERLAEYCDVFIDEGYYTIAEGERILHTALDHGLRLKVHCDELANTGSTSLVSRLGAVSADHLLCISDQGISDLSKSETVASLLPGTAYFIRMPYAPVRKLIESNAIVSLASDCNPGSCYCENMQFIISLAAMNMRMTAEECITAATLNGAAAINQSHLMGSLETGKAANLIVAEVENYSEIIYHSVVNHITQVWVNGKKIV